jgi:hypothetical protein
VDPLKAKTAKTECRSRNALTGYFFDSIGAERKSAVPTPAMSLSLWKIGDGSRKIDIIDH